MALLGAQFVNAVSPNPVGSLQAYAGASAPTGWLLCDGTSYTTAAYPELYSVLSYTYGGSGANFNVPDLRGRVLVGKGTHVDVDALGDNDGSALANRRPKHQHTIYDPTHTHSPGNGMNRFWLADTLAGGVAAAGSNFQANNNFSTISSASTGVKVNPEGAASSSSPQDGPAYLVTNYIIRAVADAPRSGLAYGSTPPIVTALPANPQFGDVVTYIADATNGVAWNLQYDATGTYPWKFIGGSALRATGVGGTTSSAVPQTTGTPSLSVPLAGDYDCSYGCFAQAQSYATVFNATTALYKTATAIEQLNFVPVGTYNGGNIAGNYRAAGLTASQALSLRYWVSGSSAAFGTMFINTTPIRVSA